MEDKKIKLLEQNIEYKKGFKWQTLSYSDILQAYLRIEEVNGRLCCGVASFDMHFLVLVVQNGDTVKLEVSDKETAKGMLEEIKKKNPKAEIGYKKTEQAAAPVQS